jgi:hypothetical protein
MKNDEIVYCILRNFSFYLWIEVKKTGFLIKMHN